MSKRKRLQFEFTDEAYNDLEKLVEMTSAATKAEVMRRALKLFADIVEAEHAGHRVYIELEDGVREVIRLY